VKSKKSFNELFAGLGDSLTEIVMDNAENIIGAFLIVMIVFGIVFLLCLIG
jgi:hypothetical protein